MAQTGGQHPLRLARFVWAVAPAATILFGILLMILPYGQVEGRFVTPALPLIPLFYWTVHRAELLPPILIFALGFLQDLVTAGPVGVWPVVFLITYSVTLSQRGEIAGLPMRFAWAAFAGVTLVGLFAGWFAHSVYNGGFVSVLPMGLQALTTAALFPVLGWPLVFIEGEIAGAMRH